MLLNIRIDKYLWAVRIFKTRNIASEECRKGRVIVNDIAVKQSKIIREGEIIYIKCPPVLRSFKVLKVIERRVSANLAKEAIEEITPAEEFAKLKFAKNTFVIRDAGSGRPTKKDRRLIDKFKEEKS